MERLGMWARGWIWPLLLLLSLTITPVAAFAQWGTTLLPEVGSLAPVFALPDQEGHLRHLEDFRGEWVVLYFYPKDFTSGCTIEARRFQQDLKQYRALHAQVVGISADSVDSHREFCSAERLQFPLLSDSEGYVSQVYGSWMGDVALRNTFLIDPEGILQAIFPIVYPAQHSSEVLAALKQQQSA
ncbi:MAG: peroxiredoxin [Cyanobacteriota bacterium]|nr:peroxiredoxin [Cyanobacteriota bacterium]